TRQDHDHGPRAGQDGDRQYRRGDALSLHRRHPDGSVVRRSRPLGQGGFPGFRRLDDRVRSAGMNPAERFAPLPDLLAADADLRRRGRWLDVDCRIDIGAEPFHLAIRQGALVTLERGPRLMRAVSFSIRGTDEAWRRHWRNVPRPGWYDLFALSKRGAASIEGDLGPLLQNLQYFKDLLAL